MQEDSFSMKPPSFINKWRKLKIWLYKIQLFDDSSITPKLILQKMDEIELDDYKKESTKETCP